MSSRRRWKPTDLPDAMAARVFVNPFTGCWEWQHDDGPDPDRYGTVKLYKGSHYFVHRVSYALLIGSIAPSQVVDHVYARGCRAKSCCNPAHLEAVAREENSRRAQYANTVAGVNPRVLRRIATGHPRDRDLELMDAAWMLPLPRPQPVARPAAAYPRVNLDRRLLRPTPSPPPSAPVQTPAPAAEPENVCPDGFVPAEWLATYLHVTERLLATWRRSGTGPAYHLVGGVPHYQTSDITDWIDRLAAESEAKRKAKRERRDAAASAV